MDLAIELGMSNHVIRPVIARLTAVGYLITLPNRGSFVRPKEVWPFATLIRLATTYCHPEVIANWDESYESLQALAKRTDDEEMNTFKQELRKALEQPETVPRAELSHAVQYDDGSAEKFLRRLWRDLYPAEPVPEPDQAP
jgi:DNA-binding FadR family transcriptional regulator